MELEEVVFVCKAYARMYLDELLLQVSFSDFRAAIAALLPSLVVTNMNSRNKEYWL